MAGGTFPTSVPTYTITAGSETLNTAAGGTGLSGLLNQYETDIAALSTKLGIGASTSTLNTVLVGDGTGTSKWSSSLAGLTLTNPTITVDTISGFSSASTVTIGGVTITSGVLSTANSVTSTNIASFSFSNSSVSNPYKFRARRNAAFTPGSSGSFVLMPFDTEDYDTNNNFDVTTNIGRYTAPVAGFYQVNARLSGNGTSQILLAVYKNGSVYQRGSHFAGSGVVGVNYSDVIQLAASDYIEIYIFMGTAAAIEVSAGSQAYFSSFLVSKT